MVLNFAALKVFAVWFGLPVLYSHLKKLNLHWYLPAELLDLTSFTIIQKKIVLPNSNCREQLVNTVLCQFCLSCRFSSSLCHLGGVDTWSLAPANGFFCTIVAVPNGWYDPCQPRVISANCLSRPKWTNYQLPRRTPKVVQSFGYCYSMESAR